MSDYKICDNDNGFACPMKLISAFTSKIDENIEYDLFQCNTCGLLVKYDKDERRTFIKIDNSMLRD
jgi:hypothetical protein